MYSLRGIPISRGIAIGKVLIRHDVTKMIRHNARIEAEQVEDEIKRYQKALGSVKNEILNLKENPKNHLNKQNSQLIEYYFMLLNEEFFVRLIPARIRADFYPADAAMVYELGIIKQEFDKIENEYFRSRFLDLKAIADRVIRKMYGDIDLSALKEPIILAAEEISPAEVLHISKEFVLGIATESGGTTSHAAIIAESLEIPAVFGIKDLLSYVKQDGKVIVDGYKGTVVLDPDTNTVKDYEHIRDAYSAKEKEIFRVVNLPTKMSTGEPVELHANVSNTMDLNIARRHGAEGIGLFRTELAFITSQKFLNEDEQFELYKEYLLLFQDKEVVIRTLDLGGDKFFGDKPNTSDPNPFLGWRSIRIFLKEVDKFKQQLRAIIRASVFNDNLKILIPMISSLDEVRKVKKIFKECEEEVKTEGKPFKYNIPLGIMIEIPSSAILSDRFAKEVDFFSIGTNDLTQYTLAVDRNNQRVASFYRPLNPAVLELTRLTIENANKNKIPVSVCGEIARNPLYVRMLLGMGVRKMSVNPAYIPLVKSIILKSDAKDVAKLWENVCKLDTPDEIETLLKQDLKKNLFEIYESYFYDEKKDWKGLSF
jgi:phosphotransferase system enzyme I (PtsI)